MNIRENYIKNKKKFLFSDILNIGNYRDQLLLKFQDKYFDKKNNESIRNVSLKKFFDFNYKYNLPEDPSLIKKNNDGSYSIVLVNGQCEKFSDENINITNLITSINDDLFNFKML